MISRGALGRKEEPLPQIPRASNTSKILCVGVNGCGSTEFVIQMKDFQEGKWDPLELQSLIKHIRTVYINGLIEAIRIEKKKGNKLKSKIKKKVKNLSKCIESDHDHPLGTKELAVLKELLSDSTIQEIIQQPKSAYLQYFWDHFDRINDDNYYPTHQDISISRIKTTEATSSLIRIEKHYLEFIDAAQIFEKNSWKYILEDEIAAVIYFTAVDEFDVPAEGFNNTKLEQSRMMFSELVNSGIIGQQIPIILFLNHEDLFTERMKDPKSSEAFNQTFGQPPNINYLSVWFTSVINYAVFDNPLKVYITSTLDPERLLFVWKIVRDAILQKALIDMGL